MKKNRAQPLTWRISNKFYNVKINTEGSFHKEKPHNWTIVVKFLLSKITFFVLGPFLNFLKKLLVSVQGFFGLFNRVFSPILDPVFHLSKLLILNSSQKKILGRSSFKLNLVLPTNNSQINYWNLQLVVSHKYDPQLLQCL